MVYHLTNEEYIDDTKGVGCSYFQGSIDKCLLHDHEFFEFVLTTSVKTHHVINGKYSLLPRGTLMLIRPSDVHRFLYNENDSSVNYYINLAFPAELFEEIAGFLCAEEKMRQLAESMEPPRIIVEDNAYKSWVEKFFLLMGGGLTEPRAYAKAMVADFFSYYFLNDGKENFKMRTQWLHDLYFEMSKIENLSAGIDKMVEISGKNVDYIGKTIKKYMGISSTEYINRLRIRQSEHMLINTNMSIIEICYECGFENVSYFYRIFKKLNGMSPKQFREAKGEYDFNQKIE